MQLPVTLLYDYQSVAEIVEYINARITASPTDAACEVEDGDEPLVASSRSHQQNAQPEAPSNLLKVLRCESRRYYCDLICNAGMPLLSSMVKPSGVVPQTMCVDLIIDDG